MLKPATSILRLDIARELISVCRPTFCILKYV